MVGYRSSSIQEPVRQKHNAGPQGCYETVMHLNLYRNKRTVIVFIVSIVL